MNKLRHTLLALLTTLTLSAQAQVKVAVFTLNDFHGAFVRNDAKGIVGAPSVWQTLDSLKRLYPYHITVSGGDNFGGSYFYNATHGALLPTFFNDLGIRISAVGNHEFDDGQQSLADKWRSTPLRPRDWDITYVCSNVRDTKTGHVPPFAQPFTTAAIDLPGGKEFTIAFVGLIASSTPRQVSTRRIAGLHFDGRYTNVLDSVLQLPEADAVKGATLRLLLTHNGTCMNADGKPEWDDADAEELSRIGNNPWHAVISSHTHKRVCGTINDAALPVIQGRWHGDYIGMLLCTVDTSTMKVLDVEPHTIPCSPKATLEAGPKRLQAQIDSLLQHTKTAGGTPIGEVLTTIPHYMEHDRDNKYRQSEVGTLVCKAYAETYRCAAGLGDKTPVIGCSHFGSIRAGFAKGPLSVLDVGEALPFANKLRVFALTGRQLRELVQFGLHNERYGWLQTGNLDVLTDESRNVQSLYYVSPGGKRTLLKENKKYYLVADEFIVNGGDGYSPSYFPAEQEVKGVEMPATTDAFIQYLRNGK